MTFTIKAKRESHGRYTLWHGCMKVGAMIQGDRGWTVSVSGREETCWRFNEARNVARRLMREVA